MALCGYVHLLLFNLIFPIGRRSEGDLDLLLIIFPLFIAIYTVPFIVFIIDFSLKLRIKKSFLLHNIFYDLFIDLGLLFYVIPFFFTFISYIYSEWYPTLKDFIPFFLILLLLRIMKMQQRIRERKQKA